MAGNIDFSQVDLFVGIVIGGVAAAIVGFMFWRAKVVMFSWEAINEDQGAPSPAALTEIKAMIGDMRQEIKGYVQAHLDCQKELPEKYVPWKTLNERILDKLEEDRRRRWGEFDRHRHDPSSGVLVKP
jgi:hypothetical protein